MISRELMLNDWVEVVSNDNLKYVQIAEIYQSSILTKESEFESEEVSIDNIKPIHLTPEILEKNGFYQVIDSCKIDTYHDRKNGINITMFSIPETTILQELFSIKRLRIHYVHELQHALKLGGIDKTIEL